jgi:hypothetical protein
MKNAYGALVCWGHGDDAWIEVDEGGFITAIKTGHIR